MRIFPVGLKRALLALPLYAAWNLVVSFRREEDPAMKRVFAIGAVPVVALTTVLWLAPWLILGWMALQLTGDGQAGH